jgi:hypothetical protein
MESAVGCEACGAGSKCDWSCIVVSRDWEARRAEGDCNTRVRAWRDAGCPRDRMVLRAMKLTRECARVYACRTLHARQIQRRWISGICGIGVRKI